jgi:hypothetical protein
MYIAYLLVISLVYLAFWSGFFLGCYGVMNSCMFTCVIYHLIGLQVECSGTVVQKLFLHGIRRIPVLSVLWTLSEAVVVCLVLYQNTSKITNIYIYMCIYMYMYHILILISTLI